MGSFLTTVLAADGDLTLSVGQWASIGLLAVAALGVMFRALLAQGVAQRAESAARHAEVVGLTRETTAAFTQNNAALRELTTLVQSVAQMVGDMKRE